MGFNLTNEKIKDTYEQLVQVSASALVDGEGNDISVLVTSASYAVTASFALNAGDSDVEWDNVLNKPAGIVSSSAQTIANLPSGTISGSSQVDYNSISNVPSGILSSSAQIADDISGSFTSTSASIATDIASNVSSISTNASNISTNTADISTNTADISTNVGNISTNAGNISTNTTNISTNTTDIASLTGETSSYAVKTSDNTFTGTQTFDNIAVNGTASIAYLESVTGSAKIIGDAYIILNNDTPSQRYAGVVVQDSGSTNNTASLEFDGQTNDWFYEYTDDGGATAEFGTVMFGPGYNTKGSHVYPSNNTILKGTGDHHIVDSNITDDGTTITLGGTNVDFGDTSLLVESASRTGSLIDNITPSGVTNTQVEHIVTLTQVQYDALTPLEDTLYIVADGGDTIQITASFAETASFAVTASHALNIPVTASYALSASAASTFTISNELSLGSSTITVDSASATGSLIDNVHPAIASGSTAIKHIVTIDQTAYDTISGSGNVNDDTFYIISDAGDDVYPNNLQVDGQIYSPTFAGSIASSTSSIDFDNGNFATLNCASSTFLANPSNLESGTTYTIIITNGANISGYGTAYKFAGGTEPTLSANTDVLTMVSDGTNLYATALADFS